MGEEEILRQTEYQRAGKELNNWRDRGMEIDRKMEYLKRDR